MSDLTPSHGENKMGTMPINRLLLSMATPIIISMMVQAMYNIVDSIFVAQISENALNAVSLAFPMQNVMVSVAVGTSVGVNALLSRSLGEKNFERVNQIANTGIFLAILSGLAFIFVGAFTITSYYNIQTDIAEIAVLGTDYLSICCMFSMGLFGQVMFERLLQSTGKTVYSMITQGLGAIINIVLDYLLIFGNFGFPEMGVAGAAVATVTGQTVAMVLGLILNLAVNYEIQLSIKAMKPQLHMIKRIYIVGVPSIVMGCIGSLMIFTINQILISFTETATAMFGIYFKLQSFIFMPVFGLNSGMVPIVAYNYGARNKERLVGVIKLSIKYACCIMFMGFLIFQIFPRQLLTLFNASPHLLEIGVPALHIIGFGFLFPGVSVIIISAFQALGYGFRGLMISVLRQVIILVPLAYLLSLTGNLTLVWVAFPVSEMITTVFAAFLAKQTYDIEIANMEV